MNRFLIIIFLSMLASCSQQSVNNFTKKRIEINETVQIARESEEHNAPNIEEGIIIPSVETSIKKSKNKVVGVFLNGSGYRSFLFLDVFSSFEKMNFKYHVISGFEFGALLATLLAKYDSPEKVEWKLFGLRDKLASEVPYSRSWFSSLETFLKKEFENEQIHSYSKVLSLPQFDKKSMNYKFVKRGSTTDLLIDHFRNLKENMKQPLFDFEQLDVDWPILISIDSSQNKINTPRILYQGIKIKNSAVMKTDGLGEFDFKKIPDYSVKNKQQVTSFVELQLKELNNEETSY